MITRVFIQAFSIYRLPNIDLIIQNKIKYICQRKEALHLLYLKGHIFGGLFMLFSQKKVGVGVWKRIVDVASASKEKIEKKVFYCIEWIFNPKWRSSSNPESVETESNFSALHISEW
jgi:hypothetical protein